MDKKKDEFNLNYINNNKKITQNHLKNLDEFIQKMLEKTNTLTRKQRVNSFIKKL